MRIWFMAPDMAVPSGGIKVIHRLVEHLVALGQDAVVWHGRSGFGYPDWPFTAPVETGTTREIAAGDVVVVPETRGSYWGFLPAGQPVVMLCQAMDFVFASSDFLHDEPGDYPGWPDAVAALATSRAINTFLNKACPAGFPLHHVPVEVEDYFTPLPKERRIALMPRRRRDDLLGAVQLVRRSGRLAGWEIVLIDDMSQAQVAEELGRAAIFLFGAEREGFGLPGAEAMAAGCHVVGFTGDGAKEYLLPQHSSPVLDSDVVGMAEETLAAMDRFDNDPAGFAATTSAARAFVREHYSAQQVRAGLSAAFAALGAEGSPARLPATVTMTHYGAHAPAGDLRSRARVLARHTARRAWDRWHG